MAGDVGGDLLPWVLSIGGGVVTSLVSVAGVLWNKLAAERREHREEVGQLRHELAEANDKVIELTQQAQQRTDGIRGEHVRDLRRLVGLSNSLEPPARSDQWPPAIIRSVERALPPPKKTR